MNVRNFKHIMSRILTQTKNSTHNAPPTSNFLPFFVSSAISHSKKDPNALVHSSAITSARESVTSHFAGEQLTLSLARGYMAIANDTSVNCSSLSAAGVCTRARANAYVSRSESLRCCGVVRSFSRGSL